MESDERFRTFKCIRDAYHARDRERLARGELSMGETTHGFWGTTNLHDAWLLFRKISLEGRRGFLDLGCGDGRIVAVASLFTDARGVEGDADLVREARAMFRKLGLDPALIQHGAYEEASLEAVDTLFAFPDKELSAALLQRLDEEFRGTLYLYTDTYPLPRPKGRTVWVEQLPVLTYEFGTREIQNHLKWNQESEKKESREN